jgi:plasmid stability protein
VPQILIRHVEEDLLKKLKDRARRSHRSLQGEVTEILEQAVRQDVDLFLERAAQLRHRLAGRTFTDSTLLLAEDRAR